jgi:UDP-N-acetylmuramoyl-L-alanyl-D-glutamate--2,6-diaminopimelate ligase
MPTVADIAERLPGARVVGDPDVIVGGLTHDSRQVREGDAFAALQGERSDGTSFVDDAVRAGAVAIIVPHAVELPISQIIVADTRTALGPAAAACYGDPTDQLTLVGITGTNGKTTITYLLESALRAIGARPGVMGTVDYRFEDRAWHAHHTTPEAPVIQAVAREMVDAGATHLVLEASSHGLALGRLAGCAFDAVAFTNLTQDHLDFHTDMDDYAAAKLSLFTSAIAERPAARVVVNLDDRFSATILRNLRHPVIGVSCDPRSRAAIRPLTAPRIGIDGIEATVTTPGGEGQLSSQLLGDHNLNNLLVALGVCLQLDGDLEPLLTGLATVEAIPGRLERVPNGRGFTVLVDYSHTPDALATALASLRPLTAGRLICAFGCGGDRDHAKRPMMGRAVAGGADLALVTSDNPRTEDPAAIIAMIVPGVVEGGLDAIDEGDLGGASSGYVVEVERARAIRLAIGAAAPGDTVLIAGKGHEDYQILGTQKIHFDDREQALDAIAELGGADG